LEYEVNGRIWERAGNDDRNHAPHLVAPAAGEDRWVAIVCETDRQWQALCDEAGLGGSWRTLDGAARRDRRREIDAVVAAWTCDQEASAVAARLQAVGVPAHGCDDSAALWDDPQLAHRGHWVVVDHALNGRLPIEGARFAVEGHEPPTYRAAPTLGQHTFEVLHDILGYDEDRIADLAAAEVLE
jgi:benzylsuccinate CoA-transferase BbsF subunit